MSLTYYVQNAVVGLAIALIIYAHIDVHDVYSTASQRIFKRLLLSNILLLTLEMLLNIFSGMDSGIARALLPVIVCVFYVMNPVPEALWILYLNAMVRRKEHGNRQAFTALISVPLVINLIFSISSLFGGFAFYIDSANVYHRGPYFWLMTVICYSYVLCYVVFILVNRKRVLKHEFTALVYAAVPPILAGVLQSMFYGISILWLALSFSLLIIYINIQSTQVYIDHLTGLANRRKFEVLLWNSSKRQKSIGGIMIDIDHFKHINDVYGHDVGDKVLENVGILLKKSLRKQDFAARIGGDEFIILLEAERMDELEHAVNRIRQNVRQFNMDSPYPFQLRLSMGYDIWDLNAGGTQDQFLKQIDQKMYQDKRAGGQ